METAATGIVAEFDEHAGFGWIESGEGDRFWFHCTRIADGSRRIETGTAVRFSIVPGHLGRWEAATVEVTA